MNRQFFLLLALILVALMFYIRLYIEPTSWINVWGIYFFVVPVLFLLSIKFIGEQVDYRYPIIYTVGVLISILLYRGDWVDNYIIHRILATLFGTFVSILIYLWIKRYYNLRNRI
jgi:hypothetical protein